MANAERCKVEIDAGGVALPALLSAPENAKGVVLFAQPTELGQFQRADYGLLARLGERGYATLAVGLTAPEEAAEDPVRLRFDISRLSARVVKVVDWLRAALPSAGPTGVVGGSTAATAAIVAATQRSQVSVIVSMDGRPDLAVYALPRLATPTLLLVRDKDEVALQLNQIGADRMHGPHQLRVVSTESETIESLALDWFAQHLRPRCHGETNLREASSTSA
jgi:putative phosphoribosyl transferase